VAVKLEPFLNGVPARKDGLPEMPSHTYTHISGNGTSMASVSPIPTYLRRLLPAMLLAATAALSGGAVGDPAIACAEPQQWDEAGFTKCAEGYEAQREDDYVSWYYGVRQCCISFGGVWRDQQPGQAPRCDPPAPIVHVPPGGVIETFTPAPPPPVRQPPGVINETLAPVGPGQLTETVSTQAMCVALPRDGGQGCGRARTTTRNAISAQAS
jgi:hypothetical protein